MTTKLLALVLVIAPLAFGQAKVRPSRNDSAIPQEPVTQTMQEAIAFERHKDAAAARQARIEARRGRATANTADRSVEPSETGRVIKDEKAPGTKSGK